MDNSFFLYTSRNQLVQIERFHLCAWEFKNSAAIVEFGCEINHESINGNELTLNFFIPWLSATNKKGDMYPKLRESSNSKFIFNDSIQNTISLDGGRNNTGVIHEFYGRGQLCILPVALTIGNTNELQLRINTRPYRDAGGNCNIYFRFYVETTVAALSIRKHGLNKSTIIYDLKVNEKRNLPDQLSATLVDNSLCPIHTCFCLNIIPNDYEISCVESSVQSVRNLEYESFTQYLGDGRFRDEELMVLFKKKSGADSYAFFSVFTKERIGAGQYLFGAFVNLFCGLLLYLPSVRLFYNHVDATTPPLQRIPFEVWLALFILLSFIIYLVGKLWIPLRQFVKMKIEKK